MGLPFFCEMLEFWPNTLESCRFELVFAPTVFGWMVDFKLGWYANVGGAYFKFVDGFFMLVALLDDCSGRYPLIV